MSEPLSSSKSGPTANDAAQLAALAPTAVFEPAAPGLEPTLAHESQLSAGGNGASSSVGQRFLILRPLGKGGLGIVSVARDAELNREVALKEIRPEQADDPRSRARFFLEGELTGRLEHPGIVPVYSLGTADGGRPYYAMRLVRGATFKAAIEEFHAAAGKGQQKVSSRDLEYRKLLGRFVDVCHAVAYAHSRGVLHRDLKPANILLGPFGETLVVDWGLAKVMGQHEPPVGAAEPTLQPSSGSGVAETMPGSVVGTPTFMSPEQAGGQTDQLGPASDIYSLGANLYCLLTGVPPFTGTDALVMLGQVQRGEFSRPREVKSDVPAALEAICLKAMALRPEDRHASADALAEDIEHWLADEPVAAWREPWPARAARWGRRHKPVVAGAAVLLVAAVAALGIGAVLLGREQRRTEEQRDQALAYSHKADERADSLERQLYINRINLAYRECLANNVLQAEQLLSDCPESRRGWEWDYTRRLCHLESASFSPAAAGHYSAHDLAYSPDGSWIAVANQDGTISLLDSTTGKEVHTIASRSPFAVFSLAFQPDGTTIAAGRYGQVQLWDVRSGKLSRALRGPEGVVGCIRFSPDGRRIAAASTTSIEAQHWPEVKVWDRATGKELGAARHNHWGEVSLAFSPDSRQIVSVNVWESSLRFHDAANAREIRRAEVGVGGGISDAAYSPDGRQMALSCRDGSVLFWDVAGNSLLRTCRAHTGIARSVAFSSDGLLAASAGNDGAVKLWETGTGREIANYRGHNAWAIGVSFSPDGTRLASLGHDPAIKLWEVGAEPDVLTLRGNQGWAFRAMFSADNRRLATSGFNIVRVRDADSGRTLTTLRLRGGGVMGLALSPDASRVAASGEFAKQFDLWDTATGQRVATFTGHSGLLRALAYSPDGRQIASAGEDHTVRLWDAATAKQVMALHGHSSGVFGVVYSPDGRQLASIDWKGTVRLWDVSSGQELRIFACGERRASPVFGNAVAFSPDGRLLAAVGQGGQILIWDLESGNEPRTLSGHNTVVNGLAFSPDGRRLASAASDNTVKLWDVANGEEVFTLRGHVSFVLSVAFSPDGRKLVSAAADDTEKVWETVLPGTDLLRQRQSVAESGSGYLNYLNNTNWLTVRQPDRTREEYEQALRQMEKVCRLETDSPFFTNTLGVAQYRAGRYQEALQTLTRSEKLDSAYYSGPIPADLAFLAMVQHRLGHSKEAQVFLGRLREVMKSSRWRDDAESKTIFAEAEMLIEGKKPM